MKRLRFHPTLLAAALLLAPAARADEATSSIKFSDPAKPGTVKIILARGDLRVSGVETSEVTVRSEAKAVTKAPRKDGLRVLTASTSFGLTEKDNVITLDAADGWTGGGADFHLNVPLNTSIVVQNSWGGDITCAGLRGDIEINAMNGEIELFDVSGGVVVSTMNGEITARIRELREGKPLSFTSMNGEVVLRAPADLKANIRLRTQNGSVLTDFPESALVTKTESAPRGPSSRKIKGGVLPPEAREALREASRAIAQAGREASEAIREGTEAAARAERDAERAERDAERAERDAERTQERAHDHNGAPVPPKPPVPPVPTITGGKLVTGTLNGGGPEISVATMNGDVTLRQLDKK